MALACVPFLLTLKGCVAESFTSLRCFVFVEWGHLQGVWNFRLLQNLACLFLGQKYRDLGEKTDSFAT